MSGAESVATLKLKVTNRESGLLEWRPCECSVTSDFRVVLQPSPSTDSDDEDAGDAAGSPANTVVEVDLAAQLLHIEQKKKNKARCELVYKSEASGRTSEELMAPSAKICQQWVERVLDAQQRARRYASARQGEAVASARAAAVSPLPASVSSVVVGSDRGSHELPVQSPDLQPSGARSDRNGGDPSATGYSSVARDRSSPADSQADAGSSNAKMMASSAESNSSMSTSGVSFTLPPAIATASGRRHRECFQRDSGVDSSQSSLKASNTSAYSSKAARRKRVDLSASTLSSSSCSSESESESSFMGASYSARFLPPRSHSRSRHHKGEAQLYRYSTENNGQDDDGDDDDLSRLSPRSRTRVAAALRRQRVRLEQRQLERSLEATSFQSPRRRQHELSSHQSHSLSRRRESFATPLSARSASIGSGLIDPLDACPSPSYTRDEEHRYSNQDDVEPRRHRLETDDSSSKQELRMLQRVEEALRHLEHENAQRKQREEALAAHVQTLKDALRVKTAEREHVACEFRAALHEKEKWQQAAQNTERLAGQLREELAIAREETQLLARDKLRLKRQNGELLAQVHRLDSLVYGRF